MMRHHTRSHPSPQVARAASGVASLLGACLLACVAPSSSPQEQIAWDVRGNYALTYDDTLTVRLDLAGARREQTVRGGQQLVDLGTWHGQPLRLDLAAFCARPEVTCPSESLWSAISIDQRDVTKKLDLHVLNLIDNTRRDLPPGQRAPVVAGLVDHRAQGRFVVGLGADSAQGQDCGVLGVSWAGGRFERHDERLDDVVRYRTPSGAPCSPPGERMQDMDAHDMDAQEGDGPVVCEPSTTQVLSWPEGARVKGITQGEVTVAWLAGCAFGPLVAGATLSITTGFSARRVGELDPPAFTPIPQATLPAEPDATPDAALDLVDDGSDIDHDMGADTGDDMGAGPDM